MQLGDSSTICPKGVIEDEIVSLESWEYPSDFIILETKSKLGVYPLILGRPWLATTDAYIGCRTRDMTIINGPFKKKLTLYPLAKLLMDTEEPIQGEKEDNIDQIIQLVLTINMSLALKLLRKT